MPSPTYTTSSRSADWDEVSQRDSASWYLDPLVAAQKSRKNAELVLGWVRQAVPWALKTDAFEEAYGDDSPLPALVGSARHWIVMDGTTGIVERARRRNTLPAARFLTADVTRVPLRAASIDLIFSNSTLDHFETAEEFENAIGELTRLLRPGGVLVLTTDNPANPGYWLLRAMSATALAPFPLGYTPGKKRLRTILERAGLEVREMGVMIHNPRGISTVLFLILRRLSGPRADGLVRAALAAFDWLGRLPTRDLTACFLTVHAVRRPAAADGRQP